MAINEYLLLFRKILLLLQLSVLRLLSQSQNRQRLLRVFPIVGPLTDASTRTKKTNMDAFQNATAAANLTIVTS